MNILVISAHPDDETIGMGGTIFKLKADGHKLFWLVMTRAFSPKWDKSIVSEKLKEVEAVGKFYGFEKVYHAKFKAASLSTYPQHELVDEISAVIGQIGAGIVYIPPLVDIHQDHEITSSAALVACKPTSGSPVEKIYSYEIPVTTKISDIKENAQKFNYFVNISNFMEKKFQAMNLYKTELKELPHPRSIEGLRIMAKERGLHAGFEFAESFCLVLARDK